MEKIERLIECLKKYDPEKIILFGSVARKEADELSDIDLVIIKDTEKRFIERIVEVAELIEDELGVVDVFVYTPEEFQRMVESKNLFIENVLKEGIVLHEKK